MDSHMILLAFSALTGGVSAVDTARKFIVGATPSKLSIFVRSVVFLASVAIIALIFALPAIRSADATQANVLKSAPPETAEQHYQRGKQLYFEHNRPAAIEEAKRAIALEPTNAEAHKLLGTCYGVDQNMDGAAAEFQQASDINPDDMEAKLSLAMALDAEGEHSQAQDVYRYVLKNPGSTPDQVQAARARLAALAQ